MSVSKKSVSSTSYPPSRPVGVPSPSLVTTPVRDGPD